MKRFLIRRFISVIITIFGVSFISFLFLFFTPGDPAEILLRGRGIHDPTEEMIEQFRRSRGLNDPVLVQYFRWMKNVVRGDFGVSLRTGEPVLAEFGARFPATLELALLAEALTLIMAVIGGTLSVVFRGKSLDHVVRVISIFGISVPSFLIGLVSILVFAVYLGVLPVFGRQSFRHYILPVFTLAVPMAAYLLRLVRASLLEVWRQDYMKTAQAKGLPGFVVFWKHGFQNAILPVITVIGIQLATLSAGTVIVETIFAWPGIGRFLVESIHARDFTVIRGFVFLIGTIYVIVNLIVDIAYAAIDPRIAARLQQPAKYENV